MAEHSSGPAGVTTSITALSSAARQNLVNRKVTCPFLGPAVASGLLPVRNDEARPLAAVGDVVRIGNLGGGNLGDLLAIFAQGNHALMPGASGTLDQPVPPDHFSLDLPGSQGSHAGHSGILQGDPSIIGSGRFSQEELDRLVARANGGYLSRADIGTFIAENIKRDPDARVFPAGQLLSDALESVVQGVPALVEWAANKLNRTRETTEERELVEKLTKVAGDSNLVGACGEFALLFAFFEHQPGAKNAEGEPRLPVEDLTLMFKEKKFPDGWDTWPKYRADWVKNTIALVHAAAGEFRIL
jgi:hypothetical protein